MYKPTKKSITRSIKKCTQGLVKLIWCANQLTGSYKIDKGKGLIITSIISTYLQLVHVHLIISQFLVSLVLKHFAFGSFLIESGTWFQSWVARKTKQILFIKMGFSPLVVLYTSVSIYYVFNVNGSTLVKFN